MNITTNDLVEALRDALLGTAGTEEGVTVTELCELVGRSRSVVCRAMHTLVREGRAEHVKVTRARLNGVVGKTDGYRLKP